MDNNEFKKLYDSSAEYCIKVLRQWIKNKQDAEDAFAEAISIYWIRYSQGKIKHHDNIKAYILKIALNSFRNKVKTNKQEVDLDLAEFENMAESTYDPLEMMRESSPEFKEAFKKLSEDCQKMLTAKYVYGYRYEDIAEDMGRSSGNSVKVQTFRCAQYLLKLLKTEKNKKTQLS